MRGVWRQPWRQGGPLSGMAVARRVFDLSLHARIFCQPIGPPCPIPTHHSRLWGPRRCVGHSLDAESGANRIAGNRLEVARGRGLIALGRLQTPTHNGIKGDGAKGNRVAGTSGARLRDDGQDKRVRP